MAYEEPDNNMEMPTPCQKCGGWFDLLDGVGSDKWFPNTVICNECGHIEQKEIERDDRIKELQDQISELEWTINDEKRELEQLKEELENLTNEH
jgi:hypothetical protein